MSYLDNVCYQSYVKGFVLSPEAGQDLNDIWEDIAEDNPDAAEDRPLPNGLSRICVRRYLKGGKLQYRIDLFPCDVELLDDFLYRGSSFEV